MKRLTIFFFTAATFVFAGCSTVQNHDMPAPQLSEQAARP